MIKVISTLNIKQGMSSVFTLAFSELVKESRKETGCISYQLFKEQQNEELFYTVEEWENEESIQLHMNSPHFIKSAGILTLLFIVLMVIKLSALAMFIRLPLPTPFLALIGVVGFVLGIISILKNKDRAILTLLSLPIGLLIILWTVAEIVVPH